MGHKILIESIVHSFGNKNVLTNISLECNTGEIVGVFGRNGAGKSTLFNILFGTLKPKQATIYLDGKLFTPSKHQGEFIGYHTQEVMLPKFTKTRDLISLYLPLHKQDNVCFAEGVHEMSDKNVGDLSLGQQRYLQLLLILNLDHQFIILDEPFSMVEPLYKELIKKKLLAHRANKGFLVSDHYYRDILDIADKVTLLKDGAMAPILNNQELIDLGYLSAQAIL